MNNKMLIILIGIVAVAAAGTTAVVRTLQSSTPAPYEEQVTHKAPVSISLNGIVMEIPQNWEIKSLAGSTATVVTDSGVAATFSMNTFATDQTPPSGKFNVMGTSYGAMWDTVSTSTNVAMGMMFSTDLYASFVADFGAHAVTEAEYQQIITMIKTAQSTETEIQTGGSNP